MTTIEWCEKGMKKSGYNMSQYDRGVMGNVQAVLGDNMLLWLLPVSPPSGRGLSFVTEDMRLTKDMEDGRSMRRKAHALGEASVSLSPPSGVPKRRSPRRVGGGAGSTGSAMSDE